MPTLTPKAMPVRPAGAPCTLPAGAAHRGASSEEPENTMAAFTARGRRGCPGDRTRRPVDDVTASP
ncbi:hypothetical protein ACU686_34310 [Yinghuangia aomiensis]